MHRPKILAVVLAGGQGNRLDVLTRERAKPALRVAGGHRLVDVPLSNLRHSGIDDVIVSVQYHASTLDRAVANGRPWDLDRTRGGLRLVGPQEGRSSAHSGFAEGNADVLLKLRPEVRAAAPDVVLVLSADHYYGLDYRDVVDSHLEADAACTVVTHDLSKTEAVHHATVVTDGARVVGWEDKPSAPATSVVATEVFAYDPEVLLTTLGDLNAERGPDGTDEGAGLGDFGEQLLPRLIAEHSVVAHRHDGYWRDAGRPDSYLRLHRDLLAGKATAFCADWPLLGPAPTGPPALVRAGALVEDSMLSSSCVVEGEVVRSVLGPGVRVAAGARVIDSVLFEDVAVAGGAVVGTCIVDEHVDIGAGARIGTETGTRLPREPEITLVGRDGRIGRDVHLEPGSRLEPGTTV